MPELNNEKEKILDFAHDKFIRDGFYKISMDEIARDLQISKKTIYKYFHSKDILLESVCDFRIDNFTVKIDSIVESGDDCIMKLLLILNLNKKSIMYCGESWFRDLRVHAPHLMKKFEEVRAKNIHQMLVKLVEQGKKEKLLENVPAEILIRAFIGAIDAVTNSEFVINSKFTMHDTMKITSEIFLNGILTPFGRERYANTKKLLENALI